MTGSRWGRATFLVGLVTLTVLASALGLLAKDDCRDRGWSDPREYVHYCYSDIPNLYAMRGLDKGAVPYADDRGTKPVEYPVLTGAVMWLTAQPVPPESADRFRLYFDVNAALLALSTMVAVVATALTTGSDRRWDVLFLVLSPALVLTMFVNWDLHTVALTALAFLAWSRQRSLLAGVLLGLAVAAKFYPLVLLGPLAVLCLRTGRLRPLGRTAAGAVAAWLAVNLPVALLFPHGWSTFYSFSEQRPVDWSSPWLLWQLLGGSGPDSPNLVAGGTFAVCCLAIAVLGLAASRRPRLAQLCFLTLAAFCLTNKVYSPQFVLWLLPFAVAARPVLRDQVVWQASQVLHFFGIWAHFVNRFYPTRGLTDPEYAAVIAAHLVGTLWLVAVVVRDIVRPEHDVVRAGGADDPWGGPLDRAPDVYRLHLVQRERAAGSDRFGDHGEAVVGSAHEPQHPAKDA